MESFAVDKSFYEISDGDDELKDLWASELDPTMQEVLRLHPTGLNEWNLEEKDLPGLILHDRLMTDAALGTRPIKTEHSYSLASDGDSLPDSPSSHPSKMDDMEDECFPCISMKTACSRLSVEDDAISIKDEPMSETDSINSSCPSSPQSSFISTSDIHHFNIDFALTQQMLGKPANLLMTTAQATSSPLRKMAVKIEPGFSMPPTPSPSSSSSEDSEDNTPISQPPSPAARKPSAARLLLSHHATTRQPIHTPLISSQPKGSTGSLMLTEEEKRTLIAEGYPVPTRLPLTKAEEKSLKKIRRKIKNKISAQESRRKKKEYMDQLERKVEVLVSENSDYRKKIENLQDSNTTLLSQLQKLQAIVNKTHPNLVKQFI